VFAYSRIRIKPRVKTSSVKGCKRLGFFILSFNLKKKADSAFEMKGCELIRIMQFRGWVLREFRIGYLLIIHKLPATNRTIRSVFATNSSAYITKLCKLQMMESLLSFTGTATHRRTSSVMFVATTNCMHKLLGYVTNNRAVCCPITYRSEFALKKIYIYRSG